jgi:hypothetical protein
MMLLFLEGVASMELKLFLKAFIMDKVFNLKTLNERIHGFDYEYYDSKDKPSEISSSVIQGDAKISWNAIEMWVLIQ